MDTATKIIDTSTYLIGRNISFEIKTITLPHVPETTAFLTAMAAGQVYRCTMEQSAYEVLKDISIDALTAKLDLSDCNTSYIADIFIWHVQPLLKNIQQEIPWL